MNPLCQPTIERRTAPRAPLRQPASRTRFAGVLLVILSAVALTSPSSPAQTRPKLADYFTEINSTLPSAGYAPLEINSTVTEDLNGDGNQDLIVLGVNYPGGTIVNVPQPGRVFLGDGNGRFTAAPTDLFPVDTLMTVHPSGVLFADFNADGRPDMFLSMAGFDTSPWPGEQNRLYLSRPEGGWRDATENLPPLSDFTQVSAVGDISGRGIIDIFVSNGYAKPDRNPVLPYTLLNTGSGQFTLTRTNIPAGDQQLLDPFTAHTFDGVTLADLNGDGLPELIVRAVITSANARNRRTTILWNRSGVFVETDKTELPAPEIFPETRLDADVQRLDVNQDGLPDLVLVGTGRGYSGWFVQIFINKGNRQFVDETADRIASGDASGAGPFPFSVQVVDFNEDGAPDFSVEFRPDLTVPGLTGLPRSLPFIWLNDGAGHFSTLKVGDLVAPGREDAVFGRRPHLVATRNGYSFMTTQFVPQNGMLRVYGLLATKPYRITSVPSALRH
jgi:hypothetical protein